MHTICCGGHLSCPHPLPCMPPTTHTPCHACPPATHTPLPCMPLCHACLPCHAFPLPCMPPLWTEWLTDRCENITFPQLCLQMVIISNRCITEPQSVPVDLEISTVRTQLDYMLKILLEVGWCRFKQVNLPFVFLTINLFKYEAIGFNLIWIR